MISIVDAKRVVVLNVNLMEYNMIKKYELDIDEIDTWPARLKEKVIHVFMGAFVLGMVFATFMFYIFKLL